MNLSYSFPLKKYLGRVIIFAFNFCLKEAMLVRLRVSIGRLFQSRIVDGRKEL